MKNHHLNQCWNEYDEQKASPGTNKYWKPASTIVLYTLPNYGKIKGYMIKAQIMIPHQDVSACCGISLKWRQGELTFCNNILFIGDVLDICFTGVYHYEVIQYNRILQKGQQWQTWNTALALAKNTRYFAPQTHSQIQTQEPRCVAFVSISDWYNTVSWFSLYHSNYDEKIARDITRCHFWNDQSTTVTNLTCCHNGNNFSNQDISK